MNKRRSVADIFDNWTIKNHAKPTDYDDWRKRIAATAEDQKDSILEASSDIVNPDTLADSPVKK